MDSKKFIKELDSHVKSLLDNDGCWSGDYDHMKEYDVDIFFDFEKYIKTGEQSIYADKHFACEWLRTFSSDNDFYSYEGNIEEVTKRIGDFWKEYKKESNNMSKNDSNKSNNSLASRVFSTAMDDGVEVATRLAAKQLSRGIAEPLTALLISGLGLEDNDSIRGKVAKFLASDIGLGLVSFALSFGVEKLPLPALAEGVVKNLSRELRVQGEMAIADPVVEMVGAPLRMMLTEKVLALPIPGLIKQLPQQAVVDTVGASVKEKSPAKKAKKKAAAKKSGKKSTVDSGIKVTVKSNPKSDAAN